RDPELVAEGPWFQSHFDSFTLPPGARLIAETDIGPQAYLIGRSLGLQFHPEVTPEIMAAWVGAYRHELDTEGVDPDALLEETRRRAATARANAERLLNAYLDRVARITSRPVRPWRALLPPTIRACFRHSWILPTQASSPRMASDHSH